jgi:hypothetical protein
LLEQPSAHRVDASLLQDDVFDIACQCLLDVGVPSLPAAMDVMSAALAAAAPSTRRRLLPRLYAAVLACNDYARKPHLVRWFYTLSADVAGSDNVRGSSFAKRPIAAEALGL